MMRENDDNPSGTGKGDIKMNTGELSQKSKVKAITTSKTQKSSAAEESKQNSGEWSAEEHCRFLEGLKRHGRSWKDVASHVKTRTYAQVRKYAYRYLNKIDSYWTANEHQLFLEGLNQYGRGRWKEIASHVYTKNKEQVSFHAKEYFEKEGNSSLEEEKSSRENSDINASSKGNSAASHGYGPSSALLRQKSSESNTKSFHRTGKWSDLELEYVNTFMKYYEDGLVDVPDGSTLRQFLSHVLQCTPMRITKKLKSDGGIKNVKRRKILETSLDNDEYLKRREEAGNHVKRPEHELRSQIQATEIKKQGIEPFYVDEQARAASGFAIIHEDIEDDSNAAVMSFLQSLAPSYSYQKSKAQPASRTEKDNSSIGVDNTTLNLLKSISFNENQGGDTKRNMDLSEKEPRVVIKNKSSKNNASSTKGASTTTTSSESKGPWTYSEHYAFLDGLYTYGKDWEKIAGIVNSRNAVEVQHHFYLFQQEVPFLSTLRRMLNDYSLDYFKKEVMSEESQKTTDSSDEHSPVARMVVKKLKHNLFNVSSRNAKRSRDQAGDSTSTSSKKRITKESIKQKNDEHRIVIPEKDKAIVTEKEEVINNKKKRSASDDIDDTHCPICLEKLNDPHIVPECCHRFCKGCIEEALEHRRECPICRGRVTSRRSLRRDEVFGKLLRLLEAERAKANANNATTKYVTNVDELPNDVIAADNHQTKFGEKNGVIDASFIDSTSEAQNEKKKSSSGGEKGPSKENTLDCPIFLQKTYHMIDSCDPTIAYWSDSGDAFVVKDPEIFAKHIIPQFFNHNNFASFVRQLNFYGFKKIKYKPIKISKSEEERELKYRRFHHDFFLRGRPDLLCIIKKTNQSQGADQDVVNALKNEVTSLKGQLANMQGKMEKDLQSQLQQKNHRLYDLQTQLQQKNHIIYYLQTQLQQNNHRIQHLESRKKADEEKLQQHCKKSEEKNLKIKTLEKHIRTLSEQKRQKNERLVIKVQQQTDIIKNLKSRQKADEEHHQNMATLASNHLETQLKEKKCSTKTLEKQIEQYNPLDGPIFIQKTYHMIDSCDPTIASWSDSGDSFAVKDPEIFAKNIISQYFKHNNFASFVRQLNFYGFRKFNYEPIKISKDVEGPETKNWRFHHDFFLRGRPDLLCLIKRTKPYKGVHQKKVNALENEVTSLKGQLAAMQGKLKKVTNMMKTQADETMSAAPLHPALGPFNEEPMAELELSFETPQEAIDVAESTREACVKEKEETDAQPIVSNDENR